MSGGGSATKAKKGQFWGTTAQTCPASDDAAVPGVFYDSTEEEIDGRKSFVPTNNNLWRKCFGDEGFISLC